MKRTTNTRKSTKGQRFTSDFIPYDIAMSRGNDLLWDRKRTRIGFYIILSVNTGMRVSEVLARRHSDFQNKRPGDDLRIYEPKTQQYRDVQLNEKVLTAYRQLLSILTTQAPVRSSDFVFLSQKGGVYRVPSINAIIKEVFSGVAANISTHSLRKSFGRQVYETNGRSEDSLIKLNEIFHHDSPRVTRGYLGITREEIRNIFMNL